MYIKHKISPSINSILDKFGLKLIKKPKRNKLATKTRLFSSPPNKQLLPEEEAENYLRPDNPKLRELKQKYLSLNYPAVDHSLWTEGYIKREVDLRFFRDDYAYVWQSSDMNTEIHYLLTTYFIKTMDKLNLLNILEEDNLFGANTITINKTLRVSRDLLDSIVEIYFLEKKLGISKLSGINILDIGSGYGRLAHRIIKSLPNVNKVFCTDAVAESTFISDYYLRFRKVNNKAIVVPLHEIENTLMNNRINIAVNIQSFSECSLSSISWWIDLIVKYKISYLMVVPNPGNCEGKKLVSREKNGHYLDFFSIIKSKGYKLIAKEPKYLDSDIQKHGITPTFHYLFELIL